MKFAHLRYEDFGSEEAWENACKALQEEMGYDMSLSTPGFHHWRFAVGKVDLMGCDAWIVVAQDAHLEIEKGQVIKRTARNYGDVHVYVETPDGWHKGNGFQLRNSSGAVSMSDLYDELREEMSHTEMGKDWGVVYDKLHQAEMDAFNAWFAEQVELLSAQVPRTGENE